MLPSFGRSTGWPLSRGPAPAIASGCTAALCATLRATPPAALLHRWRFDSRATRWNGGDGDTRGVVQRRMTPPLYCVAAAGSTIHHVGPASVDGRPSPSPTPPPGLQRGPADDDPSSDADAAADRPLAIPAARWAPAGRAWAYLLDAAFTAGFEARFGPRHALFLQEVAPLPVVARHQRRRRWRPARRCTVAESVSFLWGG